MACEMSASYTLLVPLMLVSTISYLLLGKTSLYEKQVVSRWPPRPIWANSARGLLEGMYVRDVLKPTGCALSPKICILRIRRGDGEFSQYLFSSGQFQRRVTGILSVNDIREIMFEEGVSHLIVAKDVASPNVVRVFEHDSLQEALDKMVRLNVDELPVVKEEAPDDIIAMISKRDIIGYYHSRGGGRE